MISDEELRRYRASQFTDEDVVHCTGLSARAWRELIKTRAVATVSQSGGRGRVRLCGHMVLKRAAVIGALNRAGLSLAVSGQIAYFVPFHTLLFELCDPCAILLEHSAAADPQTKLQPRRKKPRASWFTPDRRAAAEPQNDWLLKIYDRRFVAAIYSTKKEPMIFGDLRDGGASFVAWWPRRRNVFEMGRVIESFVQERPGILSAAARWEDPTNWVKDLKQFGYVYEKHDEDGDPLCMAAEASVRTSTITTTVNMTLAIRKALRRYFGIEPEETSFGT